MIWTKTLNIIEKSIGWLLLLAGTILLFLVCWGFNKGFDFSDEGFMMMGYTLPHDIQCGGAYQVLFNKIFCFFNPGIIFYRYIRLILGIIASVFLYNSIIKYFEHNQILITKKNKIILIGMMLIGLMSSYSIFTSILSYNSITFILGILFCMSMIEILLCTDIKNTLKWIVLISIIISIQLISRFPTAIVMIGIVPCFILVSKLNFKQKISSSILLVILSILGIFLMIQFSYGGMEEYLKDYKISIKMMEHHNSDSIIQLYKDSFRYAYEQAVKNNSTIFYLLIISAIISRFFEQKRMIQLLFFIIQLICIGYYIDIILSDELYESGMLFLYRALDPYIFLGLSFLLINILSTNFSLKNILHNTSIILLLVLYPFICGVGTNNELTLQSLQFLLFWMVLFFFYYQLNYEKKIVRSINLVYILVFATLAISQTISGYIFHPYRLTSSLDKLNIKFKNEKLHQIYTDKNMYETMEHFEKIIPKSNKELQIIDFCKVPGIIYALNGYTPRNAWISRSSVATNIYNFKTCKTAYVADYIFVPNTLDKETEINEFFKGVDINLENDYTFIDSVTHPLYNYNPLTIREKIWVYGKK
jgi:hypothetical protein